MPTCVDTTVTVSSLSRAHAFHTLRTCSVDFGLSVTIYVGAKDVQETFSAHRGLLVHYSSYFRAALKPEWKEGDENAISLQDDDPDTFQVFFHWLYTKTLYNALEEDGSIPLGYTSLFRAYFFADARGIPEFANAVIGCLFQVDLQTWPYPYNILLMVYDNTLPESNLRKFLVDVAINAFTFSRLETNPEMYPKEFLSAVILRCKSLRVYPGSKGVGRENYKSTMAAKLCDYHDHSDPHTVVASEIE
jgi:hypothetical protein